MKSKQEQYRDRLLKERPATTKGGMQYRITNNGYNVVTLRNGQQSGFYVASDYPVLFGWRARKEEYPHDDEIIPYPRPRRVKEISIVKPARAIEYKGYRYIRTRKIS